MEKLKFSCTLVNNSGIADLAVELWLDNKKFFDANILPGKHTVEHEFEDFEKDYCLQFVLKNKTIDHTQVSEDGKITSDVLIEVENICFDDINIDKIVYQTAKYMHNFNNSTETTEDKFFGSRVLK